MLWLKDNYNTPLLFVDLILGTIIFSYSCANFLVLSWTTIYSIVVELTIFSVCFVL